MRSTPLAVLTWLLCCGTAAAADLLIENVTIVSPEHATPLTQQHVLIRDGRISAIGTRPLTAAAGTRRLDGRGRFLAPGLMDSHVHVSEAPGLPWASAEPSLAPLREAYAKQQPRSYLYFGVTQVLDLFGLPAGIAAFQAQPQRPDLFRCGPAVVLNGYPSIVLLDEAKREQLLPDYIFEPANAQEHPLPPGADPARHTPEFVVDQIAASGARCVKIFIEDGFGPRAEWPIMSRDTLARVRAATRKRGLLLVAHANALDMQRIAVAAEVDVITHGLWNWNEHAGPPGVPGPIAAHLRALHAKRIGFQPTLRVLPGSADLFRADTLEDPQYAKVAPAALLAWYASDAGQRFKSELRRDFGGAADVEIAHTLLTIGEHGMRAVRHLHEIGHPLLLASDTPSAPTYGNQPGYDTYREMRLMAQSGVPLAAILQAATLNNARQFGLQRDYGSVAVGKIANLLMLRADPLQTIRAWADIDKIILHGAVIERESLAADGKAAR